VNGQACGGRGVGDEVDDGLVCFEWSSAPVVGDSGEEPVFDLVPFAGSGWVVADGDVESGCLGQSGEFELPQPGAMSVGSAAVGCDENPAGVGVFFLAQLLPPFVDGGYSEDRRVVVDTDRDPSAVFGQVIDPVGNCFPSAWLEKS
jgi:hypothetical protein